MARQGHGTGWRPAGYEAGGVTRHTALADASVIVRTALRLDDVTSACPADGSVLCSQAQTVRVALGAECHESTRRNGARRRGLVVTCV